MHKRNTTSAGFTIVELLIVVVVIAILAAISMVAFTGIQDRANNSSIVSTASQAVKLTKSYVAANGTYPYVPPVLPSSSSYVCITVSSGCMSVSLVSPSDATFEANLRTIGAPPQSVPVFGENRYGVIYHYNSSRTLGGELQPVIILYYLNGTNRSCGLTVTDGFGPAMEISTTGNSASDSGGKTACVVSIPGPSA